MNGKQFLLRAMLLIIPVVLTFRARCGDSTHVNAISLQAGYQFIQRQDLIFSPFIHEDGSIQNIQLGFRHTGTLRHEVMLAYGGYTTSLYGTYEFLSNGELTESFPHSFYLIDVQYALSKKVFHDDKWQLFAGGIFDNNIDVVNYGYGRVSFFGYFATFACNAFARVHYNWQQSHLLEAGISIPLFALVARSPYLINDDEFIANNYSHNGIKTFFAYLGDGQFATLNHLQQIAFDLNYKKQLSAKWSIGAGYGLHFTHYSEVASFTSIENKFHLTAEYTF